MYWNTNSRRTNNQANIKDALGNNQGMIIKPLKHTNNYTQIWYEMKWKQIVAHTNSIYLGQ